MFPFRRLRVWGRAHALAVTLLRDSRLDRGPCGRVVAPQLRRAALSIPANIAEGAGSTSHAQFARFLGVALASANELDYHLVVARDAALLSVEAHAPLAQEVEEIKGMLTALLRRVRHDPRASGHRAQSPPRQTR